MIFSGTCHLANPSLRVSLLIKSNKTAVLIAFLANFHMKKGANPDIYISHLARRKCRISSPILQQKHLLIPCGSHD